MEEVHSVSVNRKAADRVDSGHPWIFASDIVSRGEAGPGEAVTVIDHRHRPIGTAHYSSTSQIALRLLDRRVITVDRGFYLGRLRAASTYRKSAVIGSDAYRVVHAEADLLPGFILDRYGDAMVAQFLDQGMDQAAPLLADCIQELFAPRALVARNDVAVRKHEALPVEKKVLAGELDGPVEVHINGLTFHADLLEGPKTGVFLDQRENYVAAAQHARGHILDCFTSSGGFALHLARRCESLDAVDSSGTALETAKRNRDSNGLTNIAFRQADVFDLLASYVQSRRRFDMVVLDPPAFAKSRSNLEAALRAYRDLNLRALKLLGPGGVLVTCSCSHHVSEAQLLEVVAQAALEVDRTLRVLERRSQAADHPVLLTVPETLYLKCIILQVV